jgi:hypothetical protein
MKKRLKKAYIMLVLFFISQSLFAQEKVDLSIQLLTNDFIGDVNFDNNKELIDYVKIFSEKCKNYFENETEKKDILVLLTIHKSKNPSVQIFYKPDYDSIKSDKLTEDLKTIKPINSLYVDYSILFILKTKGGINDENVKYIPDFVLPDDQEEKKLKSGSLTEQVELIKNWAKNFAIPVLQAFEENVDDKYAGVKAMGIMLQKTDFSKKQDVIALTERNSNYWRATLEMSIDNQLIPMTKICMHIANGEFDYVSAYIDIIPFFMDKKTVAFYLFKELKWRLNIFNENLEAKMEKGIQFHDSNQFDKAIEQYVSIIQEYTNSAWANYELYFSENAKHIEKDPSKIGFRAEWDSAKQIVYACNPLYPLDIKANNGVEGYLLVRRNSITSLFKDEEKYDKDFVEFADIALDLKVYGFAAQLYWLIMSNVPKDTYKDKNILAYFLYCLDKLGDQEIKKNFKGNFDKEFKKIEKEQKKQMENSSVYKSFKKEK